MARPVSVHEREWADAVLKALGAHTYKGAYNPYLESAIIAWARQEGGFNSTTHNVLWLKGSKASADIGRYVIGTTAKGFAIFRNETDAALATAARLTRLSGYYGGIVRAIRLALPQYEAKEAFTSDERAQAEKVLLEIAKSPWNESKYGLKPGGSVYTTTIYARFYEILQTGKLPAIPAKKVKVAAQKPKAKQKEPPPPQYLRAPPLNHRFPDPYTAGRFYRARHARGTSGTMDA